MGFKGKIIYNTSLPEGQYRKPSDNSKLKSYLPNFQFTPIEEGIKKTTDWFIQNFENARR